MLRFGLALVLACLGLAPAQAQPFQPPIQAPTTNSSVKITTGLTYQLILAANAISPATNVGTRHSITIQNNQTTGTDLCYIIIGTLNGQMVAGTTTTSTNVTINGVTMTAAQASINLILSEAYTRYFPFIPSDAIYGTCTTTGDSMYVDTQ